MTGAYDIRKTSLSVETIWHERGPRREQPLLVVWEVLGHLELLLAAGIVDEIRDDGDRPRFALSFRADPRTGRSHARTG